MMRRSSRTSAARLLAAALALTPLSVASTASAQPAAAPTPVEPAAGQATAEPVDAEEDAHAHGTRQGRGDSRGQGDGDGLGRGPRDPAEDEPSPAPEASAAARDPWELRYHGVRMRPSATYRLRYVHTDGRDFAPGGVTDTARHRARLGLGLGYHDWVRIFAQVQDVRTLGEETSPLDASADGLDMHQAYVAFRPIEGMDLRLGRQEICFANQRLVANREFFEQAQSFDALRFTFDRGGMRVDAFASLVRENQAGLGLVDADRPVGKAYLAGLHAGYELLPQLQPGVVLVAEHDRAIGRRRVTAGALLEGAFVDGVLRYTTEGYYQLGRADGDVSYDAFLLAANARVTLPVPTQPFVELHGDFLSGDDQPGDPVDTSFDVPFGRIHSLYGEMDVFQSIPADTDGRGLRDIGFTVGFEPVEGLTAMTQYRLMQAMASRDDGQTTFGHEVDTSVQYRIGRYARFRGLYGFFVPKGLMELLRGDDIEHLAFVTVEATL